MTEEKESTFTTIEVLVKKTYRFEKGCINGWDIQTILKDWFIQTPIFQSHATRDYYNIPNLDQVIDIKVDGRKVSLLKLKGIPNHRQTKKEKSLKEARIFRSKNRIRFCLRCNRDIYDSIHHFLCETCYNSRNTPNELKNDKGDIV